MIHAKHTHVTLTAVMGPRGFELPTSIAIGLRVTPSHSGHEQKRQGGIILRRVLDIVELIFKNVLIMFWRLWGKLIAIIDTNEGRFFDFFEKLRRAIEHAVSMSVKIVISLSIHFFWESLLLISAKHKTLRVIRRRNEMCIVLCKSVYISDPPASVLLHLISVFIVIDVPEQSRVWNVVIFAWIPIFRYCFVIIF